MDLKRKLDMLSTSQKPLINQFYNYLGLKEVVGSLVASNNSDNVSYQSYCFFNANMLAKNKNAPFNPRF